MKRFFTKKSVAPILAIVILVSFFPIHFAHASVLSWIGSFAAGSAEFLAGSVGTVISSVIELISIPLASISLAIAGSILDFSVQYTVYGQGFAAMKSSIQGVWVLLRDTANICFIFILLYAAIQQIITGATKKNVLVSVIISAILINFSLFVTRVVVDASNLVATSIYNQITVTANPSGNAVQGILTTLGTGLGGTASQVDLSGRIMDGLKLSTIFDSSASSSDQGSISDRAQGVIGIAGLINSVIRLILFLITTFIFMALSVVLVGRFVMLVILMATSPIGFIGEIVPGLGETSKTWRKTLTDQILVAPLLMFFMLLTIRLSQILNPAPTPGSAPVSPMILFFNFFLIAYLLLKSVSITKKMSGPVGSFVDKISATATGLALGAATGGTALIARQTIGRGANMLAQSQAGQRLAAFAVKNEGNIFGGAAKLTLGGIKGTAKSTFDMRGTKTATSILGHAKEISGMSVVDSKYAKASGVYGKGQTGYAGLQEKKTQEALEEAKAADKSAKAYEQRVVDLNPKLMEAYKNKKEAEIKAATKEMEFADEKIKEKENSIKELNGEKEKLNKQLENEKDEDKKNDARDKLKAIEDKKEAIQAEKARDIKTKESASNVKETATKARDESKANDVLKSHQEDFSAAEKKMDDYKKQQQDLADKEKELISKYDHIVKTNGDLTEMTREVNNLNKEKSKLEEDYKNVKETIKIGDFSSTLETIKQLKNMRKNMAENYRSFFKANTLQRSENREIAAKILRDTKEKEVKPEDIMKEIKKMQDKAEEKK